MNHYAAPDFWACYQLLPSTVREAADRAFALLKADSRHPSLHFKKVGELWSARVGLHHRAIGRSVQTACFGSGSGRTPSMTRRSANEGMRPAALVNAY